MVEPLHDIIRDINTGSEDGELELNRAMSIGELRKAIEYEPTDPETIEDAEFKDLIKRQLTGYANVLVTVYDEEERHFGVVDRHKMSVRSMTLDHLDQEGYKVVNAGVKDYQYKDGNAYQHAFAEFRPRN